MLEDDVASVGSAESLKIFQNFSGYLSQVCSPLLFGGQSADDSVQAAFALPENVDAVAKFVGTSECSVLLVEKNGINTIRMGLDVRMPASSVVSAYLAIIKAFEAPLDSKTPIANQVQIMSMVVDAGEEGSADEVSHSFFARIHQVTRHFYAPLARSARGHSQVQLYYHFVGYVRH